MSGGFGKIKRLVKINNVIKSVLNALAVAAVLGAVFMALDRRAIYGFNLIVFASVLGGGALFTFLVSLLAYRKSDKKLALGLDTELKLNEKVQTMVAFRDQEGSVIDVQREDADNRLAEVKKVKLTTRGRLASVLAFFIAACMLVASVTLIPQVVEAAEPEPDYEMSEYEKQLLQNLIEYVERSEAVEKEKEDILKTLRDLQTYLNDTVKESAKKDRVVNTILDVREAVDKVNFLDDIKNIANDRGFTAVNRFADALIVLRATSKLGASMPEAFAAIEASLSPTRSEFTTIDSFERMGDFMNEVKAVIASVKNENLVTASTDPFISALSAFSEEVYEFCSGTTPEPSIVQEQFDIYFFGNPPFEEAFAAVLNQLNVKKVYDALAQENKNIEVGTYVEKQLMSIFNIAQEMLPGEEGDITNNVGEDNEYAPPEEETDQTITNGGLGDGNLLFGANDTIYYPEVEDFVQYGDALAFYQNKIIEMIESGMITDEKLIDYYSRYFDLLFGSEKA